jgi:hypothetical protein
MVETCGLDIDQDGKPQKSAAGAIDDRTRHQLSENLEPPGIFEQLSETVFGARHNIGLLPPSPNRRDASWFLPVARVKIEQVELSRSCVHQIIR